MTFWLDIAGSFLIGSMLLLNVMRMNASIVEQSYSSTLAYVTQLNAATGTVTLESDLRKAGYGVSGLAITLADTSQIRFLADLGADGSTDTLYYNIGSTSQASASPNPRDRFLYRTVNSTTPLQVAAGVSDFVFSYFDVSGALLAQPVTPADIRRIQLNYTVESSVPYDTTYAVSFMELSVVPRNL